MKSNYINFNILGHNRRHGQNGRHGGNDTEAEKRELGIDEIKTEPDYGETRHHGVHAYLREMQNAT